MLPMMRSLRQGRLHDDETGNVMIAVIGLIAVTSIITLTELRILT